MRLDPPRPREGTGTRTASTRTGAGISTCTASGTTLPGNQLAAGAARRFLRAALADWTSQGLPEAAAFTEQVVDDAILLVSELVTNAVIHAGTTVDVLCRLETRAQAAAEAFGDSGAREPGLVIEVSDQYPARVLRGDDRPDPGDHREGGRGLQLVAALSDAWGISYRRDRKTVWCRLDLTGPPPAAGSEESEDESEEPLRRGLRAAEILAPAPSGSARKADSDWINRGSLSFLAEASDLLAGQLDEDNVAVLATQLLVPRLADWCAVWLYGTGGRPRLSSVWHGAEHRIDGLRAVLEKTPPPPGLRSGTRLGGAMPWPWPATDDMWEHGGALAVPLVAAGRWHGTLLLGRTGLLGLPGEVVGLVEDFGRRVALAVDTARQYARQAMISTVLQRGLLPPAAGRIPGVDHAVVYEPTAGDWVGGDFYDLFPAGDGRWCFALGDVCGNGPEAASLTGIARPVLRLLAREGYGVPDVLDRLNKALADEAATALIGETGDWEGGQARFLSLLYGEIVPYATGRGARCTLASAGHPLPLVLTPDGRVREAASPQMLLGIGDDTRYDCESFDLTPGETLLCVTDGVTERRRGHRQFDDDDGLAAALGGCVGLNAVAVAERIRRAVHEYDDAPPADDLALLVLQAR
ncbi:SpoIIE family protein phosphatase [Streptomyces sp. NPDC087422]|uniref:SpoIIE family protein phosphatase n=1 Tax=Streptomyces sp. NPDC087422 TaxID=3365786 RepID=UPI00381788DE